MPKGIYDHYKLRGKTNWWKGKKRSLATREKIGLSHSEEKSYLWRGNDVGYFALHHWVNKYKGRPQQCEHCGAIRVETKLQWANKDHTYKRNLDDFIALCVSCHRQYDLQNNNKAFQGVQLNGKEDSRTNNN